MNSRHPNAEVVTGFCEAFQRLDARQMARFYADDVSLPWSGTDNPAILATLVRTGNADLGAHVAGSARRK